jgi:hypothetical protein
MNNIFRNFIFPYSILIFLVLLESKLESKLPEKQNSLFQAKTDTKNYTKQEMYLKNPHILLYSEGSENQSTLFDLNDRLTPGKSEILDLHAKVILLPKGEKIVFYKSKDDRHFLDFFRYGNLEGTIQKNEKDLENEMSLTPTEKENHPLASALEIINKKMPATTELCLHFHDSSFGEMFDPETPVSKLEIIKERNLDYLNYQITNEKLQKNIQILKTELRGDSNEMNQCFTIQISDLKYYLILNNFYW